ncbi:MAG: UPF0179 family protein [Methanomassiliicoccaceae archaeon]|jgi:uncharacterized protein (UPF0179 family)|nr:UPF0179 family protein [Methanomassiliicoccaceae archaeon]
MVLITLIGETQARIGNRFYFTGPLTECKECRLRGICFNLEPGSLYEVVAVRDTIHDCPIHEGSVRVVEAERKPIPAAVPRKHAIDGSTVTFECRKCNNIGCGDRAYCVPVSIKDGTKLRITDVIGDLDCPNGENMVLVKLG